MGPWESLGYRSPRRSPTSSTYQFPPAPAHSKHGRMQGTHPGGSLSRRGYPTLKVHSLTHPSLPVSGGLTLNPSSTCLNPSTSYFSAHKSSHSLYGRWHWRATLGCYPTPLFPEALIYFITRPAANPQAHVSAHTRPLHWLPLLGIWPGVGSWPAEQCAVFSLEGAV